MAQPVTLTHEGALVSAPASSPSSLLDRLITSFEFTYQVARTGHPTIIGATDMAPFVIGFEGMTAVRVFGLRVNSGDLKVLVTSASGTDQALNVGGQGVLLWSSPYSGDQLTAIKMVGTADVDYLIAGDL